MPGASAPAALPSGGSGSAAFSASAWVKCMAPVTYAAVLEWGAAGDALGGLSSATIALDVAGSAAAAAVPAASSGVVTTIYYQHFGEISWGANNGKPQYIAVAPVAIPGTIIVAGDYIFSDDLRKFISFATPSGLGAPFVGTGYGRDTDGSLSEASFSTPRGVGVLSDGNIILANFNVLRLIDMAHSIVSTFAGQGWGGATDGIGAAAGFSAPFNPNDPNPLVINGIAIVPAAITGLQGCLYCSLDTIIVADTGNHLIRYCTYPGAVVKTLAGSGAQGFADGTGRTAQFSSPVSVAIRPSDGSIVVADSENFLVRLISPAGAVSTLAGSCNPSCTCGFNDAKGANAKFCKPSGVAVIPSSGVIVVTEYDANRVRTITPQGVVTTIAGCGSSGFSNGIGPSACFNGPLGVTVSPITEMVAVVDSSNSRVRQIKIPFPVVLLACDSTWHHVALTYSASTSLSTFLDGALLLQQPGATFALPPAAVSSLRAGWSGDLAINGGSLFAGSVSDLRIYARALSASEVLTISQPPLSFPNAVSSPAIPTAGAMAYTWACVAGFAGQAAKLTRSVTTGRWAWASNVQPSCTACVGSTYSFGGSACASCAFGGSFVSASAGCKPSPALTVAGGPTDTAFALSGSSAEGVGAFVLTGAAPTFVSDHLGTAGGALALASGTYLSVQGTNAPSPPLPAGDNVDFSASAWVKCASPSSYAAVLGWGAVGNALVTPPCALALDVAGTVCDSSWNHVALTYSASLSYYLNGALVRSSDASITLPAASTSLLRIGWSGDLTNGGSFFAGAVSDLRIFARELSALEVAALSQLPPTPTATASSTSSATTTASATSSATGTSLPTESATSSATGTSSASHTSSSSATATPSATATSAVACVVGKSWSPSGTAPCSACASCSGAQESVAAACTPTSNAVCGCALGFILSHGACVSSVVAPSASPLASTLSVPGSVTLAGAPASAYAASQTITDLTVALARSVAASAGAAPGDAQVVITSVSDAVTGDVLYSVGSRRLSDTAAGDTSASSRSRSLTAAAATVKVDFVVLVPASTAQQADVAAAVSSAVAPTGSGGIASPLSAGLMTSLAAVVAASGNMALAPGGVLVVNLGARSKALFAGAVAAVENEFGKARVATLRPDDDGEGGDGDEGGDLNRVLVAGGNAAGWPGASEAEARALKLFASARTAGALRGLASS